jgi:DeoR/GlpR family transcriptional regulator of sugar metabolism
MLLGPLACLGLEGCRFDLSILGGEGFDAEGITNSHPDVVSLQQTIIARSVRTLFCLDSSKLDRVGPCRVTGWEDGIGLVTNASPAALRSAHVRLPRQALLRV